MIYRIPGGAVIDDHERGMMGDANHWRLLLPGGWATRLLDIDATPVDVQEAVDEVENAIAVESTRWGVQ